MDSDNAKRAAKDTQFAALIASAAVLLGFVVYWWGEIQSVREMLELAYG